MVSNLYPFQLKEKKHLKRSRYDFKSRRIVGKASVNAAYINSLQHTMYTVLLLLTMYPSIMDMIQVKIKFMLKFVDSPNYS